MSQDIRITAATCQARRLRKQVIMDGYQKERDNGHTGPEADNLEEQEVSCLD